MLFNRVAYSGHGGGPRGPRGRQLRVVYLAQTAGKSDRKPASMRIIAAGSELQPGSEALYVMPDSTFKTVAALGKYHARVGLSTPNDVGDAMVGAVPLADFDQGSMQNFPFTGYIGTTQWVRTHSSAVAAFLRARPRVRNWPTPTARRWSRRWRSTPASRRSSDFS
jgi:hypothetical protein